MPSIIRGLDVPRHTNPTFLLPIHLPIFLPSLPLAPPRFLLIPSLPSFKNLPAAFSLSTSSVSSHTPSAMQPCERGIRDLAPALDLGGWRRDFGFGTGGHVYFSIGLREEVC